MEFTIVEEPIDSVSLLAEVPIAFLVESVLDVSHDDGGFVLTERRLDIPYVKDYDKIVGEGPSHWADHFDMSDWGFVAARSNGRLIGGAVVAFSSERLNLLNGRIDLALLWDIRVSHEVRRLGVGSALFEAAQSWALARGCKQLKIETQNINVPACRFYARHGCELGRINRAAYAELPDEVQLLWHKQLSSSPPARKDEK